MNNLTGAERRLLIGLGVKNLPGLTVDISRDEHWLESFATPDVPADWCIEWNEIVVDADNERSIEAHHKFGVFADLVEQLDNIMANPTRCPDSLVELDISAWALHYRNVPIAA